MVGTVGSDYGKDIVIGDLVVKLENGKVRPKKPKEPSTDPNTPKKPKEPSTNPADRNKPKEPSTNPAGTKKPKEPSTDTNPTKEPSTGDGSGGAVLPDARAARPARLVVTLPAEARLTVDGLGTRSTSERRVFITPPPDPGTVYYYALEATVTRDGERFTAVRRVRVRAGEETVVTMEVVATKLVAR
jgi:uncharacterized protein (TIGR03000 family)